MFEKLARWAKLRRSRKAVRKLFAKYNSFDLVDFLFEIVTFLFVDFYENGELETIDWSWAENYTEARQEMAKIYKWLKQTYPKHLGILDSIYAECLVLPVAEQSRILMKLGKIESWLRSCQQKYLVKIVLLRNYLWT